MNQNLLTDIARVMPIVRASGLLTSSCNVYQPDGVLGASGAPSQTYVPVAGLQGIPCKSASPSTRIMADEVKTEAEILAVNEQHILFDNYYGSVAVTEATTGLTVHGPQTHWRCIVDSITYEIVGVEADSHLQMTRIRARRVTL